MADVARLALQIDVNGAQKARQALRGLQDGSIKATKATDRLARANQGIGKASRFSANGLRQTSLQLSQVAQQGAATGNFLQALAIQLPDLALAFGPVGIALGAVAGGLASYVLGSQRAAEETESLIDRIDGLDVSYADLNDEIRETLRLEKARAEAQIQNQISELNEEIRVAEQRVSSYNNALNATGAAGARFGGAVDQKTLKESGETVTELGGELGFLQLQLKETQTRYDEYINGTADAREETRKAQESTESLVESLQFQVATYGDSERAIQLAKIEQMAKNGADAEAVRQAKNLTNALYDKIEAEKAEAEAEKNKNKSQMQKDLAQLDPAQAEFTRYANQIDRLQEYNLSAAYEERLREESFKQHSKRMKDIAEKQMDDVSEEYENGANRNAMIMDRMAQLQGSDFQESFAVLGQSFVGLSETQSASFRAVGASFDNLTELMKKGGKEQFENWKKMAMAQAVVSTALAVTNALSVQPYPVGVALAVTAGALGAAQLEQIKQQEYHGSFLGGGYTGEGSRTGGVDGRGGFPAILHPNETVVDHELAGNKVSGGGGSTSVTQVFQMSDDARREARQQIMQAAPFIKQVAQEAVLDASRKGGQMSKAMGRRR